jgi:hypothetical protein
VQNERFVSQIDSETAVLHCTLEGLWTFHLCARVCGSLGRLPLRALYHASPSPTQSGARRLLTTAKSLSRRDSIGSLTMPACARQAGVGCWPFRVFLAEELRVGHFLGELTADPSCTEAALCQLEETLPPSGDHAPTGRPSRAPASPVREALRTGCGSLRQPYATGTFKHRREVLGAPAWHGPLDPPRLHGTSPRPKKSTRRRPPRCPRQPRPLHF